MARTGDVPSALTLEGLAKQFTVVRAEAQRSRAEIATLRAEVERLRHRPGPGGAGPHTTDRGGPAADADADGPDELGGPAVSRRSAFKALGAAAAGGVGLALGASLLEAEPAAAANPNWVLDQSNDGNYAELSGAFVVPLLSLTATSVDNPEPGPSIYAIGGAPSGATEPGGAPVASFGNVVSDTDLGAPAVVAVTSGGAEAVLGVVGGLPDISIAPNSTAGIVGAGKGTGLAGVAGVSSTADGVLGRSTSGIGVVADGGLAPLRLYPATTAVGPPATGTHSRGEVYVDSAGSFFVCTTGGSPGTWQRLVPAAPGYNGIISGSSGRAGSVNLLSSAIRVFDSRLADTPAAPFRAAAALTAGGTDLSLQISGATVDGVDVPTGAVAVIGNVTAVNPTGLGDLRLYPAGAPLPTVSNLNYLDVTLANSCMVVLNAAGQIAVHVDGASTDALFDVTGFLY